MQKRYRTGGLGRETRRLTTLLHAAEARYTRRHDTPSADTGEPHPPATAGRAVEGPVLGSGVHGPGVGAGGLGGCHRRGPLPAPIRAGIGRSHGHETLPGHPLGPVLRVAGEARVFPLLALDRQWPPHDGPLREHLTRAGYGAESGPPGGQATRRPTRLEVGPTLSAPRPRGAASGRGGAPSSQSGGPRSPAGWPARRSARSSRRSARPGRRRRPEASSGQPFERRSRARRSACSSRRSASAP